MNTINQKFNLKFSSRLLVFTLIATSFFMVNCNKAPNKTGVKANTVTGKAEAAKPADVKTGENTVPEIKKTEQCSAEVLKAYVKIDKLAKANKKLRAEDKNADNLKKAYQSLAVECDDLAVVFDEEKINLCDYLIDRKPFQIAKSPDLCLQNGVWMFEASGEQNKYSKLAQVKNKETSIKKFEAFTQEKLLMSDEMKKMLKHDNLDFKMYIVNGQIKTDQELMMKAINHQVMCSFVGTSTELSEDGPVYLKAISTGALEKTEMLENVKSIGISFSNVVKDGSSEAPSLQMLACTNLSENIDIAKLKLALGTHLITEESLSKLKKLREAADKVSAENKSKFLRDEKAAYEK